MKYRIFFLIFVLGIGNLPSIHAVRIHKTNCYIDPTPKPISKRGWFISGSPEAVLLHGGILLIGKAAMLFNGYALWQDSKYCYDRWTGKKPTGNMIGLRNSILFAASLAATVYSIKELAKDIYVLQKKDLQPQVLVANDEIKPLFYPVVKFINKTNKDLLISTHAKKDDRKIILENNSFVLCAHDLNNFFVKEVPNADYRYCMDPFITAQDLLPKIRPTLDKIEKEIKDHIEKAYCYSLNFVVTVNIIVSKENPNYYEPEIIVETIC